ncbi:MAG: phenylacetate--CoA ligase family protein [Elusimicrobia bacterium]|nr:phenylacetate--CoA ligase family protein [Elusimicrobiota bacterium]
MCLYQLRSGPFYDKWEALDEEKRGKFIFRNLDEYVRFAAGRAPFYKKRLANYNRNSEFPLAGVPALAPAQLRALLPPLSRALVVGGKTAYNVFQSGGTTGSPKTTLFSHAELEQLTLPNARGFYACGLVPSDRVANLFAVGGLYMTFLHIHRMLEQYGCMNFPFSNHTPADFVGAVAKLFKINCVAGISSVVLSALRNIDGARPGSLKLEKIYYGGEHLYESDKAGLRKKFGAKIILAPGYGTVDTWYLGYQCLQCPAGVFHAHDDQCYLEIVNGETGSHCAGGETGLLYATPFLRRLTPIVRYAVGDRARWLKNKCACARTTPLFELLGRGDDILRIGFDSVDYACVQAAVARAGEHTGAVQMEKRREKGKDRLVVRVELEGPPGGRGKLRAAIEREIIQNRPTLRKAVAEKAVLPPRVELLGRGKIPRNPRTGKLSRVIQQGIG